MISERPGDCGLSLIPGTFLFLQEEFSFFPEDFSFMPEKFSFFPEKFSFTSGPS